MNTYRKNAVMTGILYFLGTAFGVSSGLIGGKVLASVISGVPLVGVDMLSLAAADSSRITWGALLTFMMGISLVGMTVFLYPVIRKASKELAMGMVLFRGALEGVFYMSYNPHFFDTCSSLATHTLPPVLIRLFYKP